jgi:hypothetical protein
MTPLRFIVSVALLLVGQGCADAHQIQVMTVLANGNCKTTEAGVRLIDYAALAELRGTHLIEMTEAPAATMTPLHLIAIVPPESPTAGYSLTLAESRVDLADPLELRVNVAKPPPDAMLAQVITHPCLVVGIENPAIKRVRVLDNADQLIGEVDISKPK